jgi:hypothetical protein
MQLFAAPAHHSLQETYASTDAPAALACPQPDLPPRCHSRFHRRFSFDRRSRAMTFPYNVSSPPPAPATTSVSDPIPEAGVMLLHRADYDLRPIAVASLAHYLTEPEEERFHVH